MNQKDVYIVGTGSFFPGEPVSNDEIDDYIQPMNARCQKIKARILNENGIKKRYYAIDKEGKSQYSVNGMGAISTKAALKDAGIKLKDIDLLCTGTTGADQVAPGFANMLQGYLKAPPMETSSHNGICMAGVTALKRAYQGIKTGDNQNAIVTSSEFPSRLFKKSRFEPLGYKTDFDSHFLRWMLSDASGSWILSDKPRQEGLSLKIRFIHTKSFSGDFPTCMQIGSPREKVDEIGYLDYPNFTEMEKEGSFLLRQDIRLLPNLFDVGVHEYSKILKEKIGGVDKIDHYLCHYSSEKFAGVIKELMSKADTLIPEERWYSNLTDRGNTGSASIFVMLDDFLKTKKAKPGEQILCFVPESGRVSVSFMLFEVVAPEDESATLDSDDRGSESAGNNGQSNSEICSENMDSPSSNLSSKNILTSKLLTELAEVWHTHRSSMWRSSFVEKLQKKEFTEENYLSWMENWIPQVREGTNWMRTALKNIDGEVYPFLKDVIATHALDEQDDWKMLHQDYLLAGGKVENPDLLERNIGGDALNAFMFHRASHENAIDLLGAIYIIEGSGQKIIPQLLPMMKKQLDLDPKCFRFLSYHASNDEHHMLRWLSGIEYSLDQSPEPEKLVHRIIKTAKTTAELYYLQISKVIDG